MWCFFISVLIITRSLNDQWINLWSFSVWPVSEPRVWQLATQHHQHLAPASGDADSSAVKPNMAGYLALRSMEENGKSRYFAFPALLLCRLGTRTLPRQLESLNCVKFMSGPRVSQKMSDNCKMTSTTSLDITLTSMSRKFYNSVPWKKSHRVLGECHSTHISRISEVTLIYGENQTHKQIIDQRLMWLPLKMNAADFSLSATLLICVWTIRAVTAHGPRRTFSTQWWG